MYERLQGYQSIDRLMEEQKDFVREGLNDFPLYTGLVRALKGNRRSYAVGIFVSPRKEKMLRYMSRNDSEGRITEIVHCTEEEPDFALIVNEDSLLKICGNADIIRKKIEERDFTELKKYVFPLPRSRTRDIFEFARLARLLPALLRHYCSV